VALREIEENYVTASILDEVPEEDIWEEATPAIPESAEAEPSAPPEPPKT